MRYTRAVRLARLQVGTNDYLVRYQDGDEEAVPIAAPSSAAGDPVRELATADVDLADPAAVAGLAPIAPPIAISEAVVLAPLTSPSKIMAIGLNYADHARESGAAVPTAPLLFSKFASSIVGPGVAVEYRTEDSEQVDYEAELAVVVGRAGRDISEAAALDHVLGYTCANDVSARDAQFADNQWVRGKSFDTFCPLGPAIVTRDEIDDVQALAVRCRVNGVILQDGTTADMIFGVTELVAYLSRFFTLEAGDVILTGTPYGVGFARNPPVFLLDGDTVEVDIEGVGVLSNPVRVR